VFTERLERLESLLEERNERKSKERVTQTLTRSKEDLHKVAEEWQSLAALASSMGVVNHPALRQLKELCSRPTWVSVKQKEAKGVLKEMQAIIQVIRDELIDKWQEMHAQTPSQRLQSRARFLMYVGDPQVQSRLRSINITIQQITRHDLPTPNQYVQWQKHVEELEQVVENHLPNIIPEVERFFDKLTTGDATLHDVTPEIMDWCRQHNLMPRIALHFSDRV